MIALPVALVAAGVREWRKVQLAREKRRAREQELLAEMVADVAGGQCDVRVHHQGTVGTWSLTGTVRALAPSGDARVEPGQAIGRSTVSRRRGDRTGSPRARAPAGDAADAAPGRGGRGAGIDEAVLRDFYMENAGRLLRFLVRKAGREDGGELLSQAFEKFFLWWPDHADHPNPVAALYQIARCRLLDHFRRLGRELTVEAHELAEAAASSAHCDGLEAVARRADLDKALTELTEREQHALELHYVAELTVDECAEVHGRAGRVVSPAVPGSRP